MHDFVRRLTKAFEAEADPVNAAGQKAYMKDQFEYYGLKSPVRKAIQQPLMTPRQRPPLDQLDQVIRELWLWEQRECQYAAQELLLKYARHYGPAELELMEFMATHKSWWDTIDFIASNCMGRYFKKYPDQTVAVTQRWIDSGNMWSQRCALLFQLKYKDTLDTDLLARHIEAVLGSKEFFINKAIGWALRQHSKTDPDWVKAFAARTNLAPLSRKEALRLIR